MSGCGADAERLRAAAGAQVRTEGVEPMTVAEFLRRVLSDFWEDPEFDANRPYGASGWRYDVRAALIRAGVVEGSFDADGYVEQYDELAVDDVIKDLIDTLGAS